MKLKNIATGKKIKTTLDFAKTFSKLNVSEKTAVLKNIQNSLLTGVSPRGTKVLTKDIKPLEQLVTWATMNLFMGNEVAPPEKLHTY